MVMVIVRSSSSFHPARKSAFNGYANGTQSMRTVSCVDAYGHTAIMATHYVNMGASNMKQVRDCQRGEVILYNGEYWTVIDTEFAYQYRKVVRVQLDLSTGKKRSLLLNADVKVIGRKTWSKDLQSFFDDGDAMDKVTSRHG